jgi:hypothetical protein
MRLDETNWALNASPKRLASPPSKSKFCRRQPNGTLTANTLIQKCTAVDMHHQVTSQIEPRQTLQ